jgi:hypothetical protein
MNAREKVVDTKDGGKVKSADDKSIVETAVAAMPSTSPMAIIAKAVEGGTDVSVLEKMFDLYERDQAREARKQFDAAVAKFQGEVKPITRVKKADRYMYAPIEQIMKTIQPELTANGLSIRFDTKDHKDGEVWMITAYCVVSHVGGHKETSQFTCPVDRDNRTKINVSQQQGSGNSYAKRYALSNALNIVYEDEDDDGKGAGTEYVTEEEAANIEALLTEVDADRKLFLQWAANSESIETIPHGWYSACIRTLDRKRKGGAQ